MNSKAPLFRQITTPLDVDDSALDALNDKLGVPTMKRHANKDDARPEKLPAGEPKTDGPKHPSQKQKYEPIAKKTASSAASAPSPTVKLTIDIPAYLNDALKLEALKRRSSAKHLVMLGLRGSGFKINDADMIEDGRRSGKRAQKYSSP